MYIKDWIKIKKDYVEFGKQFINTVKSKDPQPNSVKSTDFQFSSTDASK